MATAPTIFPTTTSHVAPAGARYHSIESAGLNMLQQFCNDYPNTEESIILPQLFEYMYPERQVKYITSNRGTPKRVDTNRQKEV